MQTAEPHNVTELLVAWSEGDEAALEQLAQRGRQPRW